MTENIEGSPNLMEANIEPVSVEELNNYQEKYNIESNEPLFNVTVKNKSYIYSYSKIITELDGLIESDTKTTLITGFFLFIGLFGVFSQLVSENAEFGFFFYISTLISILGATSLLLNLMMDKSSRYQKHKTTINKYAENYLKEKNKIEKETPTFIV